VLASFCCAQSGRAKSRVPNATVAHQLRIVSSLELPENSVNPSHLS
jgi:hypothetical protein